MNMTIGNKIFSALLSVVIVLLSSCEGINMDSLISLTADKTFVLTGETVTFNVKYSDYQDVSNSSAIRCKETGEYLTGNVFTAKTAGVWTFVAEYDGMMSNEVSVTAQNPIVSKFRKHVCLMEFTGQWCAMCPGGATTINYFVTRVYPDILHVLAFHNADEFALPEEVELSKRFAFGGYPGYVVDMQYFGQVTGGQFSADLDKAVSAANLHCGVSVSSTLEREKATITANVYSELSSKYRIAAYVLEDMIVAKQNVSGTYTDDYIHRHVVRKMLSATIDGDDLGIIEVDGEKSKEYTFDLEESWNKDNLEVCVLIIGEDASVNNMAVCSVDGGKMEYDRIKK